MSASPSGAAGEPRPEPLPCGDERRREPYLQQVHEVIAGHGYAIQAVYAEPGCAQYAYTIGMTPAGLGELLLCGLPFEVMSALLRLAVTVHTADGGELRAGGVLPPQSRGPEVPLRVIDAPQATIGVARALFPGGGPLSDNPARALQLVWPHGQPHETLLWPPDPRWPAGRPQTLFGTPWWPTENPG